MNYAEHFEPDELMALARRDIDKGDLESALVKLKGVLTHTKGAPDEAQAMIARLYAQLGLLGRARHHFKCYLEVQPDAVNETFQLGMTYYDAGEPAQALEIWEKLLEKRPNHPPSLYYRSLVLAESGQMGQARDALEILVSSAPQDNFYVEQGRKMMQAIDLGGLPSPDESSHSSDGNGGVTSRTHPKDAYKSER